MNINKLTEGSTVSIKKSTFVGLVVSGILVVLACEKKDEGKNTAASVTAEVDGSWTADCTVDNTTDSQQKTLVIDNGSMSFTIKQYSQTTTCETANLNLTFALTSSMTIGSSSTTVTGAKDFEMKLNTFTATPENSGVTAGMVSGSTCGTSQWTMGTAGTLFGCSTFGMTNLSSATVHYDIFKLTTSESTTQLQLGTSCSVSGNGSFCTTSGTRPTALNTAAGETFTKQ